MARRPSREVRAARRAVLHNAFGTVGSLTDIFAQIGFVQADPIRAPARAQDLILRPRVPGYHAGDLEAHYSSLGAEEDFVYAYGFTTTPMHRLLHPRGGRRPAGLAADVLAFVRERGVTHPRDLVERFGARREINAWGGESRATTRALELLHFRGHLRVASRDRGIRLFAPARDRGDPLTPNERLRHIALVLAANFAPLPVAALKKTITYLRYGAPSIPGRTAIVDQLLKSGELASSVVGGVRYAWPATLAAAAPLARGDVEPEPAARFLAPFDPVVWTRARLEHLWEWDYRFEAYTPVAKRRFGYYALPMLYGDDFVGWVNITASGTSTEIQRHFRARPLRSRHFAREFDREVDAFRTFLRPPRGAGRGGMTEIATSKVR